MASPGSTSLSWYETHNVSDVSKQVVYVHTAEGYGESYPLSLRIRSSEQYFAVIPLRAALRYISLLSTEQVLNLLTRYADEGTTRLVVRRVSPRKLVALLLHIEEKYGHYGRPLLDVVFDEETGEFQFVSVVLPNCDWETWRRIARETKEEMRKAGLGDLASKVAIVCLQGLQGPTR